MCNTYHVTGSQPCRPFGELLRLPSPFCRENSHRSLSDNLLQCVMNGAAASSWLPDLGCRFSREIGSRPAGKKIFHQDT
jgi:hypothetical protein